MTLFQSSYPLPGGHLWLFFNITEEVPATICSRQPVKRRIWSQYSPVTLCNGLFAFDWSSFVDPSCSVDDCELLASYFNSAFDSLALWTVVTLSSRHRKVWKTPELLHMERERVYWIAQAHQQSRF